MKKEEFNAILGVYDTHAEAVEALMTLDKHGFPMKHVALVGKGGSVKEIDGVHTWEEVMMKGTEVGGIVGGVLGVLTGLTLFLVPGLGVVYVGGAIAHALVGGAGGSALGGLGGSVLGGVLGARIGTEGKVQGKDDPEDEETYQDYIQKGKFLVVIHGPESEIEEAHDIIESQTKHSYVERQYLS